MRPSGVVDATYVTLFSVNTTGAEVNAACCAYQSFTCSVFGSRDTIEFAYVDVPLPVAAYSVPSVPNAKPAIGAPLVSHAIAGFVSSLSSMGQRASGAPAQTADVNAY